MSDYRDSELAYWLRELHYWNTGGYDLAYGSQYVDSQGDLRENGMPTEKLIEVMQEERGKCVRKIISVASLLRLDLLAVLRNRVYLDLFINAKSLSDSDIKMLIDQVKDNKRGVENG